MKIINEIIKRAMPPKPWAEGDNIPWNEPAFSERMLKEHLSQEHDLASRRMKIIDKHIKWISGNFLPKKSSQVLDLCCGPGLYSYRLIQKGYKCLGIDYSPASINYALKQAKRAKYSIEYKNEDIRKSTFGTAYDLAMIIYGEFNVFRREDIKEVLTKVYDALVPGGYIISECHTYDCVKKRGLESAAWRSFDTGLFSDKPHLLLQEHFWDEASETSTVRYYVIDAKSNSVTRYASTMQAYTKKDYKALMKECGYKKVEFYPSLTGQEKDKQEGLLVLTAKK